MHIAPMLVHLSLASHSGHHEHYSPFQNAMCKRWDTPVFKPAILSNASSVILSHNHPSGDPHPSQEDRALTVRLRQAGKLLGVEVLDHIIVGDGRYYSFADEGLLDRG